MACSMAAVAGGANAVMSSVVATHRIPKAPKASISRASTHCCSSFLGSGLHASSASPAFSLEGIVAGRQGGVTQRRAKGQSLVVRSLFGLGVPEIVVIAGVAAILFGPKKLPEIGKSLGKTVKSFQTAAKEFETAVKNSSGDIIETESSKPEIPSTPPAPSPTVSSSTDKDSA